MKALFLVLGILFAGIANAQYPNKPLRLVVPFAPGGSTDIFARLIAERAQGPLGQPVVVENRSGAAGNLGANEVVRAAPDGYTLLMATTGVMAINNALYKNMTYDAAKDLEPVIFVASITNVLIVPPDFPAKSVAELIAMAKKEPGKLAFASSGAGSSTHMSAELFKSMSGTDILHVPYKGSGQAMPDLMSGRVHMMFENAPGAVSHIKAGKLRALAQTGLKRSPALPEVPTVDESGVKGYESLSWSGIAVAAGTPRPIIERLNKDLNAVLNASEVRQKIEEQGAEVIGGTPQAFKDHVGREREKWSRLIKQNNIVVN
jgi:tripartite-type tricarboxylate transporter receptor subunit TctC